MMGEGVDEGAGRGVGEGAGRRWLRVLGEV